MKRKIFLILMVLGTSIMSIGCSKETRIEDFGRFEILEDEGKYYTNTSPHHQYLVVDKYTKIIYIYDENTTFYGSATITPFYCMNSDNEPEIAVLHD